MIKSTIPQPSCQLDSPLDSSPVLLSDLGEEVGEGVQEFSETESGAVLHVASEARLLSRCHRLSRGTAWPSLFLCFACLWVSDPRAACGIPSGLPLSLAEEGFPTVTLDG